MILKQLSILAVGLAVAAPAAAATDVDYLRAARCKGISEGLGVDAAALAAFLKAEGRTRQAFIVDKGAEEEARGRRDAKSTGRAAKASAELAGGCQAYKG